MDCVRVQDTELNDPMWVSNEELAQPLGAEGEFLQELFHCIAPGPSSHLGWLLTCSSSPAAAVAGEG